jgi:hypothetical protein
LVAEAVVAVTPLQTEELVDQAAVAKVEVTLHCRQERLMPVMMVIQTPEAVVAAPEAVLKMEDTLQVVVLVEAE